MTNIVQEELINKIYSIMSKNTRMEFFKKDLRLFVRILYGSTVVGEEFIELYENLEELENSAKGLCEVFYNCTYVGELK